MSRRICEQASDLVVRTDNGMRMVLCPDGDSYDTVTSTAAAPTSETANRLVFGAGIVPSDLRFSARSRMAQMTVAREVFRAAA